MRRAPRFARAALGLLVFGAAAACNTVLGIDGDYQSVIEKFCQCDGLDTLWIEEIRSSDDVATIKCTDYLGAIFAADPEGAQAWIDRFEDGACDKCKNAIACATAEPLCRSDGQDACSVPETCCGYDDGKPFEHYCGIYVDPNDAVKTRCFSDDVTTCKGPLEQCETDADCCGGQGLTARCYPGENATKVCLIDCDPQADSRCPGCCATVTIDGTLRATCVTEEALAAGNPPTSCAVLCAESSDCPNPGEDCVTAQVSTNATVKVCYDLQSSG